MSVLCVSTGNAGKRRWTVRCALLISSYAGILLPHPHSAPQVTTTDKALCVVRSWRKDAAC